MRRKQPSPAKALTVDPVVRFPLQCYACEAPAFASAVELEAHMRDVHAYRLRSVGADGSGAAVYSVTMEYGLERAAMRVQHTAGEPVAQAQEQEGAAAESVASRRRSIRRGIVQSLALYAARARGESCIMIAKRTGLPYWKVVTLSERGAGYRLDLEDMNAPAESGRALGQRQLQVWQWL
jgi:hypothetical protein